MSDLRDLLYTDRELALLRHLEGEEIVRVEAEHHLETGIVCRSGVGVLAQPEEVWVSSRSFDEVGYSWVKRAALSEERYEVQPVSPRKPEAIFGVATDIAVLRCAVVFSEVSQSPRSGNERLDKLVEDLEQKYENRSFDIYTINPALLPASGQKPRYALVDIGFMAKIGGRLISVATFDNAFFLDPPVLPPERLNAAFFRSYTCLPLNSLP